MARFKLFVVLSIMFVGIYLGVCDHRMPGDAGYGTEMVVGFVLVLGAAYAAMRARI